MLVISEQFVKVIKVSEFYFCISLNSCHAQVPKCLHFKKLILGQIETGLGHRTHSDVLKFILFYSRAKCIFSCVN